MSSTPVAGTNFVVTQGGVAVQAAPANPNGGIIVNPALASDQGLVSDPEPLYIDIVGPCAPQPDGTLVANNTIFRLEPGQPWEILPGQTTPTMVNARTSGHKFSVTVW